MAQNIENMAEKTSKLSIDPIYDKNWCDMPADIKLECIEKMELKERLSLRCTAKTEKSLVDSQKMNFVEGEFVADYDYEISLKSKNWILFINSFLDKTDACDFMKYIFKIGIFENLKFDSSYFLAKQCANAGLQISAKNIDFVRTNFEDMIFILEKTNIGVECIKIEADGDEVVEKGFPLEKVLEGPNIQNARFWQIKESNQPWLLTELAKIWINKNSKIGSTFQTSFTADGAIQIFRINSKIVFCQSQTSESEFKPIIPLHTFSLSVDCLE
ncbi:unnamed protein product [Caenorhabditis nigoni]